MTGKYWRRFSTVRAAQWSGTNAAELVALAGTDFEALPDGADEDPDATAALRQSRNSARVLLVVGDWVVSRNGSVSRWSDKDFIREFEPAAGLPHTTV